MIKIMEPKKQIFTTQEKKTFLEILKNYSKIIENKHTHSSALKAKNLAWQKITSEFNASPQANLYRTPKQLRRLWMNLKQRQREVIAKIQNPQNMGGPIDEIISGSNVLQIAHALMTGVDSSMDSDIVVETITNNDPAQSETNLYLSEETVNVSNQETPVFSTIKIEAMSPIIKASCPTETIESIPMPVKNPTIISNNKAHITEHQENSLNQDNQSRIQHNLELQDLEIQLLKEKVRAQRQENKSREAHTTVLHNLEYQILKEKLREAKSKADLAELHLRRQYYSDGNDAIF